jgi:hypothetical protein
MAKKRTGILTGGGDVPATKDDLNTCGKFPERDEHAQHV